MLAIINIDILSHNDVNVIRVLLYGDPSLIGLPNTLILNTSIQFLLSSNGFDGQLTSLKINCFNIFIEKASF